MEVESFCYVCDRRRSPPAKNFYQIFDDENKLSSGKTLADAIAELTRTPARRGTSHSSLCEECFGSVEEYDRLKKRSEDIRSDVIAKFEKSLDVRNRRPESDLPVSTDSLEISSDYGQTKTLDDVRLSPIPCHEIESTDCNDANVVLNCDDPFDSRDERNDEIVSDNVEVRTILLDGDEGDDDDLLNFDIANEDDSRLDSDDNEILIRKKIPEILKVDVQSRTFSHRNSKEIEMNASSSEPTAENLFECMLCSRIACDGIDSKRNFDEPNESEEAGSSVGIVENAKNIVEHMKLKHDITLHVCDTCDDIFSKKTELIHHIEEHHVNAQDDALLCKTCDKHFTSYKLLKIHERSCHSNKTHECNVCKKQFGSKSLLMEHSKSHVGIRPYHCEICEKNFTSKYTYQSHLKTHTVRPRPYTCSQCGKSFFSVHTLSQHEKTHLGIKDFVCNICGKAFGTQHNLEIHGVVHTGCKPYPCEICGKSFARRAEIRDHERTHTGEKPYVCEFCGTKFSQRSNLQSHKRAKHLDDKRYKCSQCDRCFKRKRLLDYHIKACHTGERPYKCNMCDSTFVYPEHYKKHQRIHSGIKPFQCEVCGKAFNSRDNRNAHRYVHSDKKPYECLSCGAGFMRKPLLYVHMESQGHFSDKIIVNQPRVEQESSKLPQSVILNDGQELFIKNIKQETINDLNSFMQSKHQDGVGHADISILPQHSKVFISDDNEKVEPEVGDLEKMDEREIIIDKFDEVCGTIIGPDASVLNSECIEVIDGSAEQLMPENGGIRILQIKLIDGKPWLTLNSNPF